MGLFSGILKTASSFLPGPWSAAANALGGFLGQEDTNAQNRAMSRDQMEFQERMSSTAHQREVADLQAAGLNPMLTGKYGGSSTPPGAMPVMGNSAAAADACKYRDWETDRKSTRLNSSHSAKSRMPSSA